MCIVVLWYSNYCYHHVENGFREILDQLQGIGKWLQSMEYRLQNLEYRLQNLEQTFSMAAGGMVKGDAREKGSNEFQVCQPIFVQFYIYDPFTHCIL